MLANTAAEKGVLASICQFHGEAYADIADLLPESKAFTVDVNQSVYNVFQYIFKEKSDAIIDYHLISSTAKIIGEDAIIESDATYIQRLFTVAADKSNVRSLAKKIRKIGMARDLKDECREIIQNLEGVTGDESALNILSLAETPIFSFANKVSANNQQGVKLISDGLDVYLKDLIDNPRVITGISTGYPHYDVAIGGGIQRGSVHIIGARTGIGKSLIADNIGISIASRGIKVLYLDTEMGEKGHQHRILANLSSVTIDEIKSGAFGQNDFDKTKVREAYKKLRNYPYYYVNVTSRSFDETLSIMRRWVRQEVGFDKQGRTNDCVIIYDYIKMTGTDNVKDMQETQMLGLKTSQLHDLMVEQDAGCLTFAQLNRDGITNETTAAIGASDRIGQLGDSVAIFKVKTPEEIAEDGGPEYGNRKLILVKVRDGSGLEPGDYINMNCEGHFGRITEGVTRNELHKNRPAAPSRPRGFREMEDGEPGEAEQTGPRRVRRTRLTVRRTEN